MPVGLKGDLTDLMMDEKNETRVLTQRQKRDWGTNGREADSAGKRGRDA